MRPGPGRDERVAVDLAVRMVQRHADLLAAVLEAEHLLDDGGSPSAADRSIHASRTSRTRPGGSRLIGVSWSLVKQTTSQRPSPGAARRWRRSRGRRPPRARGSGSRRPPRRSPGRHLGRAGRRDGHSGHSSAGGRWVRPCRCDAMATHSPVSASCRISDAGGSGPAGRGVRRRYAGTGARRGRSRSAPGRRPAWCPSARARCSPMTLPAATPGRPGIIVNQEAGTCIASSSTARAAMDGCPTARPLAPTGR